MTEKQVHYLVFVGVYKRMLGQVLKATYSAIFRIGSPQPMQMVRALERDGLIREQRDLARSI